MGSSEVPASWRYSPSAPSTRRPRAALQKRAASSALSVLQSITNVLNLLRCMRFSFPSGHEGRVEMLGLLVVAREQVRRFGMDHGAGASLPGELLDGAPRIPSRDGDE